MLKSHLNIQQDTESDEGKAEEETGAELVAEEKQEYVPPERVLKKSEISVRLSHLGKVAAGDGYTYLKASCTKMNLTNISSMKCFIHLQYIDVSENYIKLENLQVITALPFLILIQADKNLLNSAALNRMKYLQVVILNNNKITSVEDVYQPELCTLEVGYNKIHTISFTNRMPTLKCLDFRYNLITDISNLDCPNLDSLYLAGNKISSLVGIETLTNLRILHVRNNPIKNLNGFQDTLVKLNYINLRNCKVKTLKQIKKLKVLPMLETLVVKGCPYMGGNGEENADIAVEEEEDPAIRIEILATLPKLKKINKGVVNSDERSEAKDLMMQWIEEGEKYDEEEVENEEVEEETDKVN